MPDDEIEQRLTLTDDGRLFFTRYNYGNGEKYIKSAERRIKLDNEVTAHLLKILEEYFSDEFNVIMATDVGEWKLILTNIEDEDFCFRGSLVPTKILYWITFPMYSEAVLICPNCICLTGMLLKTESKKWLLITTEIPK